MNKQKISPITNNERNKLLSCKLTLESSIECKRKLGFVRIPTDITQLESLYFQAIAKLAQQLDEPSEVRECEFITDGIVAIAVRRLKGRCINDCLGS